MKYYSYDAITKVYINSFDARKDPLESKLQGKEVWLLPANATFTIPPEMPSGYTCLWQDNTWVLVEDHRGQNYWLPGATWETIPETMETIGPLPEGAITTKPEKTLEAVKQVKIYHIDNDTTTSILAGFDYEIEGIKYHFSYDSFDQQNFSDTANMCQLALSGTEGLPTSVTWNSYLADGTLVQHTFDAQSFLTLYTAGAMQHKATQMAIGGQRKAAVQAATTIEEVEAI